MLCVGSSVLTGVFTCHTKRNYDTVLWRTEGTVSWSEAHSVSEQRSTRPGSVCLRWPHRVAAVMLQKHLKPAHHDLFQSHAARTRTWRAEGRRPVCLWTSPGSKCECLVTLCLCHMPACTVTLSGCSVEILTLKGELGSCCNRGKNVTDVKLQTL